MKSLAITAKWLFILCLPILILTAIIGWETNSSWLYNYGFEKYNVSQTTGIAPVELRKATTALINYFNSGNEYFYLEVIKDNEPFELFNQREVSHLKDVKRLIRLDYWVLLGTLIYILGYTGTNLLWHRKKYWRRLAQAWASGSALTLTLMLALGLGTLINFDQLFYQFHLISFTNELWQLDPSRDYLIMLFPRGFWHDAATLCAGITATLALIMGGLAGWYLLYTRGKDTLT